MADHEIYVGDFEGFVGRRDELAKSLRAKGDSEGASRVRALRKPSRGAWAINQLSAGWPEVRDELLSAGAALRDAHETVLSGGGDHALLREAAEAERSAVAGAYEAVLSLAQEAGARLSPATAERVRQTLHAVALDEAVREEFEQHRLTGEHEVAGLGGLSASAAAPARGRRKARSRTDGKREAERRRKAELKAAEDELTKLERRRREAEREVEVARRAAERAQKALERAEEALEDAAVKEEAARTRVDALRVTR
jgi:chromosome segregation ATPase